MVEWCQCTRIRLGYTKELDSEWWVCAQCKKPSKLTLNQCDTCERYFKGIPGMKVRYTCLDCE